MTTPKQSQPAPSTRTSDAFSEARSLERKLRNIDIQLAKYAIAAEHKKRALLEAASPTVRRLAEAALAEPVVESGNNVTHEGDAES